MNDDPCTGSGPWHAGERTLQACIGVAERMEEVGSRAIRRFLLDQHRQFYAQLPFRGGGQRRRGDSWATPLCGHPGYRTRLLGGAVTPLQPPQAAIATDEVLICCAVPAAASDESIRLAL